MAEILFFHLQRQPLERVLPTLLRRSLDRGWRAVVRASSDERVAALDILLWTYADESFLPHAVAGDGDHAADPIVLTTAEANPNGAAVLFLVDGAALPGSLEGYERVTLLFDGNDEDALTTARAMWRDVKTTGLAATYWQEGESGGWEKKA